MLPIIILRILYRNKSLERIIDKLKAQNKEYINKLSEMEMEKGEEEVDVYSSNKSDKLKLRAKNIVAIKSADNYVEVFYSNGDSIEKKLMRNTLKDIESQLSNLKKLIRCHRTCIVNTQYIHNLSRNYSGYSLQIKNCSEKLPVSRQYLLQVRKAISVAN
jgi:DNA-binding LytR/AlgR family response regulator